MILFISKIELMVVKEIMLGKSDQTIFIGLFLLNKFTLKSGAETEFGYKVFAPK